MKFRFLFALTLMLLFQGFAVTYAQDSVKQTSPTADTSRRWRNGFFGDTSQLNSSDYQLQIEKTFAALEDIDNRTKLGRTFDNTLLKLEENDSILAVVKENVLNNSRALNLRNLQVFRTLLVHIEEDLVARRKLLDTAEVELMAMRKTIRGLIGDTVLRQLQRDTAMVQQFNAQLLEMRSSWRSTRRHLRESLASVNRLQTHASANALLTRQLLDKLDDLLTSASQRILGKEANFLWEKDTSLTQRLDKSSIRKVLQSERKALGFYFRESSVNRAFLLIILLLFVFWTYRNFLTIKKEKAENVLKEMNFIYLPAAYLVGGLILVLSIAPLFDLNAPSVYVEAIQLLVLLVLTFICWNKWPRDLFSYWIILVALYLVFSMTNHLPDPGFWTRTGFILLNILSIVFGTLFLTRMKEYLHLRGFLRFVIILHNVMNVLALFCNLFGRITLSQMLGNAAIFAFMQAIGLAVFSKISMEAILLQMVASRYRKGLRGSFEYQHIQESFSRPILLLVVLQWLVVFTTNLNIYSFIYDKLEAALTTSRNIGNANFTFGGILLFFLIIWIAHLLQKYVGYFFGDAGLDDESQNKQQRSRLLITKLIVLSIGYLLAVAASGIPIDKITIVLGALGVGIGLGLQNIVSNFVSGIILIFDRPLQIGDSVEIGDQQGKVREIGLRSSIIQTKEGAEVIIPNGDLLSQPIVNWTLSNAQQRLELGFRTESGDMEEVAKKAKELVLSSPFIYPLREPQVLFTKMDADAIEIKVYCWCIDTTKVEEAKSDLLVRSYRSKMELLPE